MQQEIRFATFNVCNLAPPGIIFYPNLPPFSPEEYAEKIRWTAQQLDTIDADVIGFQEIFSQAALKDVLARSTKYRDAHHAGIDPDPASELAPLTPSVALVSRLPLDAVHFHSDFPASLTHNLPPQAHVPPRFTRPILQARVRASNGLAIDVFVLHLKSKRPDFRNGESESDPTQFGMASLRSLHRRGAEALGLFHLLLDCMRRDDTAIVAMGDFNDTIDSVTSELLMGAGRFGDDRFGQRLFDCRRIQMHGNEAGAAGFTHMHDGACNTIDHVLVSKHFHPDYADAVGKVLEVRYLNDHILWQTPQASDHGIVLARIALKDSGYAE
ncbi:MAG: endonuclease/exonuclease/phosphatase family protein [Proteobacteria bacterium]|nr:endonuclease/exonuclease/phosphatase family protein [Pseudomonadota bacterium]